MQHEVFFGTTRCGHGRRTWKGTVHASRRRVELLCDRKLPGPRETQSNRRYRLGPKFVGTLHYGMQNNVLRRLPFAPRLYQPTSVILVYPPTEVPFSVLHWYHTAQSGYIPSGSLPASFSNSATTPCEGTASAVKFLIAVPLSVCVQRSCQRRSADQCGKGETSKNVLEQNTAAQRESMDSALG